MCKGFMILPREIRRWGWYRNSKMVHMLLHLMLEAQYQDGSYMGVEIKRGQLATGRKQLAAETGMSEREVRTCLERLTNDHQIVTQTTNRFSIITVCNYDSWHGWQKTNDQPPTSETPTDDPQSGTPNDHNNKDNKDIKDNIKEEGTKVPKKKFFSPPTYDEVDAYIREKGFHFNAKDFIDYYEADDWHYGTGTKRKKVESWKRCCLTWEKQRRLEETDMFSQQEEEEHRPKVLVINGVTYR